MNLVEGEALKSQNWHFAEKSQGYGIEKTFGHDIGTPGKVGKKVPDENRYSLASTVHLPQFFSSFCPGSHKNNFFPAQPSKEEEEILLALCFQELKLLLRFLLL